VKKSTLRCLVSSLAFLCGPVGAAREMVVRSDNPSAVPPSAAVRPDSNNRFWILLEEMAYELGNTGVYIRVPSGFVTDYASIPVAVQRLTGLTPHGQYSRAAIIHDYLYWTQTCTREQADRILVIAMKESEVGSFDEAAIYKGVQVGGRKSWRDNAAERKRDLPRVVPAELRRPPSNLGWPEYRKTLVKLGIHDPPFDPSPSYCSYGDTTSVPQKGDGTAKQDPLWAKKGTLMVIPVSSRVQPPVTSYPAK
jgi:hypothetical protein